jgi:hypothetical protein
MEPIQLSEEGWMTGVRFPAGAEISSSTLRPVGSDNYTASYPISIAESTIPPLPYTSSWSDVGL